MKIKNIVIIEEIRGFQDDKRVDHAVEWLKSLELFDISDNKMAELRMELRLLKTNFNKWMKGCNHTWRDVQLKHSQWLNSDFNFEFQGRYEEPQPKKIKVSNPSIRAHRAIKEQITDSQHTKPI